MALYSLRKINLKASEMKPFFMGNLISVATRKNKVFKMDRMRDINEAGINNYPRAKTRMIFT
jgi:hypothetical protein|tara:strand:- start:902 stop:1087 length:186 start_codon:yes stop_codon:yes gene_type:complete